MKKAIEYIAYDGKLLMVEGCFDPKSQSRVLHYYHYRLLSEDKHIKMLKLFKRMGDAGEIKDKKNSYVREIGSMLSNRNLTAFYVFSMRVEKLSSQMLLERNNKKYPKMRKITL